MTGAIQKASISRGVVMESGAGEGLMIVFPSCREKILLLSGPTKGIFHNILA